jgi:acetolactate synthase-1/2/3 large subunit
MIRLADYVANRCVEAGASHVFLVTGGGAMHLNDAFGRHRQLTPVCFHHEQSASIAAEGYFRCSNRLAVVNVTTGPGGINALNGVYGAFVDSIGMLIVSGQVKRETIAGNYPLPMRQLGDQEVGIVDIARPLVKYSCLLQDPAKVRSVMDKAIFLARYGRPGPVWVDIPIDVQSAMIDPEMLESWSTDDLPSLVLDPAVSANARLELETLGTADVSAAIDEVLVRLGRAKRPAVLLGTGVRLAGMLSETMELVRRLGIPVVTGWNAQDSIDHSSPLFCGRPGTVGDRPGNFTVQSSDFLLILGCRLNIRQISYNWRSFAPRAFKVMVDVDRAELDKPTLSIDLKIHADLRTVLPRLLERLVNYERPLKHGSFLQWCRERVLRYPTVQPVHRHERSPINPYFFIELLFSRLRKTDIVVAGNGSACVIGFQAASISGGQRFFTNSGNASMGYDLPAAIGASLANPHSRVVCLAGDGSLMMNLQELQTLVGYRLPVKVIVLNNNGYHSIRQTQQNYFSDNVFGTCPEDGVSLPDFVKLAEALRIPSARVACSLDWSRTEIQALMDSAEPALIEVVVDPSQPFSPKLASRKLPDGTMVSPSLEDMAPFLAPEEMSDNRLSD